MPTIAVDKRAFHHKLRAPKEKEPEKKPEMSPNRIAAIEKALDDSEKVCREATRCILNLSISITTPSEDQIRMLRPRAMALRDEVDIMRSILKNIDEASIPETLRERVAFLKADVEEMREIFNR